MFVESSLSTIEFGHCINDISFVFALLFLSIFFFFRDFYRSVAYTNIGNDDSGPFKQKKKKTQKNYARQYLTPWNHFETAKTSIYLLAFAIWNGCAQQKDYIKYFELFHCLYLTIVERMRFITIRMLPFFEYANECIICKRAFYLTFTIHIHTKRETNSWRFFIKNFFFFSSSFFLFFSLLCFPAALTCTFSGYLFLIIHYSLIWILPNEALDWKFVVIYNFRYFMCHFLHIILTEWFWEKIFAPNCFRNGWENSICQLSRWLNQENMRLDGITRRLLKILNWYSRVNEKLHFENVSINQFFSIFKYTFCTIFKLFWFFFFFKLFKCIFIVWISWIHGFIRWIGQWFLLGNRMEKFFCIQSDRCILKWQRWKTSKKKNYAELVSASWNELINQKKKGKKGRALVKFSLNWISLIDFWLR